MDQLYTYVRACVCMWVDVCVRTREGTCVCADGRGKVGTNECMLNTSRTHASVKEVHYPLVSFSLKMHFYNISMKTIT